VPPDISRPPASGGSSPLYRWDVRRRRYFGGSTHPLPWKLVDILRIDHFAALPVVGRSKACRTAKRSLVPGQEALFNAVRRMAAHHRRDLGSPV
jgi:hypothetical protein